MLLFLSHSGADTAAAGELKRRILASPAAQAAGLQVWLDKDDLRAGGPPRQTQLSEALEQATAFCVYVDTGGVVNWVDREVQFGLSRAAGPNIGCLRLAHKPDVIPEAANARRVRQDFPLFGVLGSSNARGRLV